MGEEAGYETSICGSPSELKDTFLVRINKNSIKITCVNKTYFLTPERFANILKHL